MESGTGTIFRSILCGVEGNPDSSEAARQAAALARGGAELRFLAVHPSFEMGQDLQLPELEKSLDEAAEIARVAGVSASTEIRDGRYAVDVLLAAGDDDDLLVIGTPRKARVTGILFGSTAIEAAHQTERPLLIARKPSNPDGFPDPILLATDASAASTRAARVAAQLAVAFDASLGVVNVVDGDRPADDGALARQLAEIERELGAEPKVSHPEGDAAPEIIKAAAGSGASLIVCGRRGLSGLKALGSVSERVASDGPCSVLLTPA